MLFFSRFRLVLALAMTLGLSACSTPPVPSAPSPVDLQIARSAHKIEDSLRSLARVSQASAPSALPPPIDIADVPPELRGSTSIYVTGPIETVLQSLAERIGYRLRHHGLPPAAPVIVKAKAEDTALISVLEDIGLQATGRADVRVDAERHFIEVFYLPVVAATSNAGPGRH